MAGFLWRVRYISTTFGKYYPRTPKRELLHDDITFEAVLNQYDKRFTASLGTKTFGEDHVWEIILLITNGILYAGSHGSKKWE